MNEPIQLLPFMRDVCDDPQAARKAAKIGDWILKA
jgi:hypothetical protein